MAAQGVFVAIGHMPNTAPYAGQLDLDKRGYIVLPHRHSTLTNIQGVSPDVVVAHTDCR